MARLAATAMFPKTTRLRWWMIGLLMLGSIVNYLTRSTLAVAAPTLLSDLNISTQEYSWIVGTFQGAIMLQPICGYVLDVLGLKLGFAIFAIAWSLISMSHALAHNWQMLAGLRGLLGFAEGSANPAGMKATAEWFPAKERGLAGGTFNIGASVGSMLAPPLVVWAILAYNWQAAFVITGALGLVWVALWLAFYHPPDRHPALTAEERAYIKAGQEAHLEGDGRRPSVPSILARRNFWGIAIPAVPGRPDLGHADLLGAALPEPGAALRPQADRAVRVDAVPRGGRRVHVRRRLEPGAAEARGQPHQRAPRRVHGRRGADDGRRLRGLRREPLHRHRADQPRRLRPPDAVGDRHHDGVGPVPAQRGGHRRRPGGHVRQRRPAGVVAADRRVRGDRRLHAVLRRAGRARPGRRRGAVDGGAGSEA